MSEIRSDFPFDDAPERRWAEDRALADAVLAGSEEAWHRFVLQYTGLVKHALRRWVFDPEEVDNLHVCVLEKLHGGALRTWRGESRLSTWIVLVARNVALDHLRHTVGTSKPRGLSRLCRIDRDVFRWFHLDGLEIDAVVHRLRATFPEASHQEVLESLTRIEEELSRSTRRRLAYDLAARSTGEVSGRLMEYLDEAASAGQHRRSEARPDVVLIRSEARRMAREALEYLQRLPHEEQELIGLRYERGWTARRIADRMGWSGTRRVFTVLERIRRDFRRRLSGRSAWM